MTSIAHVSDPHLDGSAVRRARFARVLGAVNGLGAVDALLVTGDLADHGARTEYDELTHLLAGVTVPTLVVPGNHDDVEELRRHLPGATADGPLDSVLDVQGVRIVGLDSTVAGQDGGRLSPNSLAFAEAAIAGASGHVVLAMHHPAVPVGHAVIDRFGLENGDDLAALVRSSSAVVACMAGHVHSALASTLAGRPLVCAPGVASTLRLGDAEHPFADEDASPGLALHVLAPDGLLTTRFHYLSPEG